MDCLRSWLRRWMVAAALSAALAPGAAGAAPSEPAPGPSAKADPAADLPPFPADAQVQQSAQIAGRTIDYTVTVGSLPVHDEAGKTIGEVDYVAYTLNHGPEARRRPVTFALNGGPGAASVFLNLGAIGPKRIQFGATGDSPSDPVELVDNPASWIDFTDLVFIDPIGTGFSRSRVGLEETKKRFWSMKPDVEYLSRMVYDWLLKTQRLRSPKYIVGESYGGFRGPRITHYLQTKLGVGINGLVLVSPYLDWETWVGSGTSPMGWVGALPTLAAANLERRGQAITPQALATVEAYARTDFIVDLLKGSKDAAALDRLTQRVSQYTGLDPALVRRWGGRIDNQAVLRELYRDQGKLGAWYDPNVTGWDPYPFAAEQQSGDPIVTTMIAPTTSGMVDFMTRTVGWRFDGAYHTLSSEVLTNWEDGRGIRGVEAVSDLREAVALDPKLQVLIVQGYDDLASPYFATRLIIDGLPALGGDRIQLHVYPGGHMFYSRPDSGLALRRDVLKLYGDTAR